MSSNLPMPSPLIERPQQPIARLLLAHGAGAGMQSDFMQWLTSALVAQNIEVWRFNFPYMQQQVVEQKKRPPNPMPVLLQDFRDVLAQCPSDLPLFIGGKSMGGRVASMLAVDASLPMAGVLAYGYPFHAPGKQQYRTGHFNELSKPLLILQGQRDTFGHQQEMAGQHWPSVALHWLNDGDHSFKPRKKSGYSQEQLIVEAAAVTRRWMEKLCCIK
ncbi:MULTISPECIES: alpha/beta family hydrolase [Alkalimonas]|uniref:Dienelactone hydrolase family protein n=1 Tax=Alkalimonas mucilaginosa TaxID=3057676 RepID=A0ABU7JAK9_9GAMM|nr:alpha/beta family hydrolase [Alkalimonas sp. MEB004]MEE2022695.1 dienelactone hydrolase family protein [Alkalimonas sp. MEB004]